MDSATHTLDSALRELDAGLRGLYKERYGGLVLYGSHAREEAKADSDVNLLLLLKEPVRTGAEIQRSSELVASLSLESGYALSLIPVSIDDYQSSNELYLLNARREGTPLSLAARNA